MKTRSAPHKTSQILAVCSVLFALSSAGAATPYIANEAKVDLVLVPSSCHAFHYVRAYRDGEQLVLYGKLDHQHGPGSHEGHVDLSLCNARGETVETLTLPLVNRGQRRKGWRGAHFRVKLEEPQSGMAQFRLAIHEPDCFAEDAPPEAEAPHSSPTKPRP